MSGFRCLVTVAVVVAAGLTYLFIGRIHQPIEQINAPQRSTELADSLHEPIAFVELPAGVREAELSRRAKRPPGDPKREGGLNYDTVWEGWRGQETWGIESLSAAQPSGTAPPTVHVSVAYPGASASVLVDAVLNPLEQSINGVQNMRDMTSSTSDGEAAITIHFEPGTDPNTNVANVQKRVDGVLNRLPPLVVREKIMVSQARYKRIQDPPPHAKPAEMMAPTSCRSIERVPKTAHGSTGPHEVHDRTVMLFENTSGFGFWRMMVPKNDRGIEVASRVIDRVELVSLLTDDQPSVYVLDQMATPPLARQAKRRSLDEFERLGLNAVRLGEELVWTREAPTRMFGAIRARESCLDCHANAKKGDLLGAFTYYLKTPVEKLNVRE